jgi:hypothetical protein
LFEASGAIRETESGNLSLETARCLDPQGSMCERAISRTRNLHGTFRRLMKVGGFFLSSWCVTQHQPEERNTKVKTLIAIALFAASIVGAYAQVHVNSYYRSNGTYVREHYRSYPDGIESNNWSYRGF